MAASCTIKWSNKQIAIAVKMGIRIVNVMAIIPRNSDPADFAEILVDAMSRYSDLDPEELIEVGEARLLEQLGCRSWGECYKKWHVMGLSQSRRSNGWVLTVYGRIRRGAMQQPKRVSLKQPKIVERAAQIIKEMDKYDGVRR